MQLIKHKFKNNRFKKHFHTTFSIGYIISGAYEIEIEKKKLIIPHGKIKVINPYEVHVASGEWEYINIMPEIEEIKKLSIDIANKEEIRFENIIDDINALMYLKKLLNSKEDFQKDENLTLFLSELIKNHTKTVQVEFSANIKPSIEFMHENFLKDITLEEIASASNLSKYHFIRIFSKIKKITPYNYLLNLRLEYARNLIGKMPLALIAQEANFSDQSHFIKVFKKHFGFTPAMHK